MMQTIRGERNRLLWHIRRRIIKNFMDILILSELRRAPMSSYDVITSIYSRFDFLPTSGSVYSLLYALERDGLIKGGWNGRKRTYAITSKGEEIVETALTLSVRIEGLMTNIFADTLL